MSDSNTFNVASTLLETDSKLKTKVMIITKQYK